MLRRKIEREIEAHLASGSDKIMIVEGARQVGKSYIIRQVGKHLFRNFVEINFVEDDEGKRAFKDIHDTDSFYLALGMVAGKKLGKYENTLIFLDEIQQYPQFLTLLKFLRQERRYKFIASGSMLGLALRRTNSIPIGSITRLSMHQLDFEEFMMANGVGDEFINMMRQSFESRQSLKEVFHNRVMDLFKRYLLVGGMPDAVNEYLESHNIVRVRGVQESIHQLYAEDASKYESEAKGRLLVRRIYDMIPSQMENKKKRIVARNIDGKQGDRFDRYIAEFEYLISSGITHEVRAISNPRYPLAESVQKNLLKLYLNDVGLLTQQLYNHNIKPIMDGESSINIGAVYESVVAQELAAHGLNLFYYDNRKQGEVDFIVDDYASTNLLPIEVKSGKDYKIHSALNRLLSVPDYGIKEGIVLSNSREVRREENVTYMPVYFAMFIGTSDSDAEVYI